MVKLALALSLGFFILPFVHPQFPGPQGQLPPQDPNLGPQAPPQQQPNFQPPPPPPPRGLRGQCRLSAPGCGLRANGRAFIFDEALRYAKRGDIPWQVSILVKVGAKKWQCSGTVINNEWIIAQAFCLYNKKQGDLSPEQFRIIINELNPFDGNLTKANTFGIAEIVFHQSADLAVMRVSRPLPRQIIPICMPANDRNDFGMGKVSGWPQYILNYLSTASAQSFPYDHCTGLGNDEPSLLCVVSQGPPDCGMDTGSPFYRQSTPNGGPMVLIGIKLRDEKCRESDNELSTERYLRLSRFIPWIGHAIGVCRRDSMNSDVEADDDDNESFRA